MSAIVTQLYKSVHENLEYCFNVEAARPLTKEELLRLRQILADGFVAATVTLRPALVGERVVEVGPAPQLRHRLVVEHGVDLPGDRPGGR